MLNQRCLISLLFTLLLVSCTFQSSSNEVPSITSTSTIPLEASKTVTSTATSFQDETDSITTFTPAIVPTPPVASPTSTKELLPVTPNNDIVLEVGIDTSSACSPTMDWSPVKDELAYISSNQEIWISNNPKYESVSLEQQGSQLKWTSIGKIVVLQPSITQETPWNLTISDPNSITDKYVIEIPWYKDISLNEWTSNEHLSLSGYTGNASDLLEVDIQTQEVVPLISVEQGIISTNTIGSNYYLSPNSELIVVERQPQRITLLDINDKSTTDFAQMDEGRYQRFEAWNSDNNSFLYEEWTQPNNSANIPSPQLLAWKQDTETSEVVATNVWGAAWSSSNKIAMYVLGNPTQDESNHIIGTDFTSDKPFDLFLSIIDAETYEIQTMIPLGQVTDTLQFMNGTIIDNSLSKCGYPDPVWSPDGTKLVYWDSAGKTWLWKGRDSTPLPTAKYALWNSGSNHIAVRSLEEIYIVCTDQCN